MVEATKDPDPNGPAEDGEGLPRLKGSGPFTPEPVYEQVSDEGAHEGAQPGEKKSRHKTALHAVIHERWGHRQLDDFIYEEMIKYANPHTAKKTANGFQVDLHNGRKIEWQVVQENGASYEMITGAKEGFSEEDAAAMVALSQLRGWQTLDIEGTPQQKELLWLAAQRYNLQLREAFDQARAAGHIPEVDDAGNPIVCPQIAVTNFTPEANTKAYQVWKQEVAAYEARRPKPSAPPPEDGIKSEFDTAAEKSAATDEPAAEAPVAAEESTFAPELPTKRERPASSNKHRRGHGRQTKTPAHHKNKHKKGHHPR